MKFNSKTPIGGSDFLRHGFGRQAKNKVVILFHTTRPISFFAAAISHRDSGSDTSIFRHRAVKINQIRQSSTGHHGGAHMTSVWTSERFEPGCAVGATAALQIAREGHADP